MDKIHEKGLERVFPVVAKDEGLAALLPSDAVEVSAPQTRAERAIGAPSRYLRDDNRVGIAPLDPVRDGIARQELRQHMRRKTGLRLVQIARKKTDGQEASPAKDEENGEQGVRILTTGQADEPTRPGASHCIG